MWKTPSIHVPASCRKLWGALSTLGSLPRHPALLPAWLSASQTHPILSISSPNPPYTGTRLRPALVVFSQFFDTDPWLCFCHCKRLAFCDGAFSQGKKKIKGKKKPNEKTRKNKRKRNQNETHWQQTEEKTWTLIQTCVWKLIGSTGQLQRPHTEQTPLTQSRVSPTGLDPRDFPLFSPSMPLSSLGTGSGLAVPRSGSEVGWGESGL